MACTEPATLIGWCAERNEGSPPTFARLSNNVARWRTLVPHLEARHGLAGRRGGIGFIAQGAAHLENAVGPANRHAARVPYLDLDSIGEGLEAIDLLKVDIEGSEADLVANYPDLIRESRVLAAELHGTVESRRATHQAILDLGFELLSTRTVGGAARSAAAASVCAHRRAASGLSSAMKSAIS